MGLMSRASLHTWGRRGSARPAAHRTAPGPFRAPHTNHRCTHARLYKADLLFALGLSQAPPGSPWSVAQARGCRPVGFSVCRPHPASERSGGAPNRASGNMQQDRQEQCNATTHGPNNKKWQPAQCSTAAPAAAGCSKRCSSGATRQADCEAMEPKQKTQDGGARPNSASWKSWCSDLCSDLTCAAMQCILL